MKALVFRFSWLRLALAKTLGLLSARGYLVASGPLGLLDVPEPRLLGERWVLVQTRLGGICGSDLKQVFLEGALDNPLTALISFPHVMGHEVVGEVVEVGREVTRVQRGDRVACYPWLTCAARGLPLCASCQAGRLSTCLRFTEGPLGPGMHYGTSREVSGGFAPLLPAHETMCFKVPEGVSWEQAVLADPFAVALQALQKAPPARGETVLVVGCGALGSLLIHLLERLYPGVRVLAADQHEHLRPGVEALGARYLTLRGAALIEAVGDLCGARPLRPMSGLPWLLGGVDKVYDLVGSARTIETALRLVKPGGAVVLVGVGTPARFEWTPLFFKEVALVGSSGCGLADLEGRRAHAFELFLDLVAAGRLDPAFLVTHTFPLARYREAFLTAADKRRHRSLKVAFDLSAVG